jgi:diguanylate cyclase (GGDEF)-like protein
MGADGPRWDGRGGESCREHIVCVSRQDGTLATLRQQLSSWFADAGVVVDGVSAFDAALPLLDGLLRAGDQVAALVVDQELGAMELLGEARRRLPATGSVLLVDRRAGGTAEALAYSARHAGLSSYLHKPYEALQLQLTVEGLLAQHRLQRRHDRLLHAWQEQKRELEVMNSNLEARIRERTMALEEANRRLSQLAVTDGLTGLFNHRYLQEHLVLEVERSLRTGIPLGMLMVDVDNFRQYNNRFGHQTGDEVLRRVARLIGEHRRVNDVVARYGGEEFALLLINADHRVAANIGERLRARVCAEPFPQTDEMPTGMLTISVGVASCPTDGTTAASLLAAADAALFRAKNGGRNQVQVAGEPSEVFFVNVAVAGPAAEDPLAVAASGGAPEKW